MAFIWSLFINSLIFLLIAVSTVYVYFTWNFGHWKKKNVAFIKPLPVLGNFGSWALMRSDIGGMFRELYQRGLKNDHGLVGIWVFRKPALVVTSPELMKTMLVKDFNHFADRTSRADRKSDPLGADNLFFSKDLHWKLMRTKLTPLFSSAKIKNMFELMNEICDDLVKTIEQNSGEPIEVKDITSRYTTDVISTTAYGLKANTLSDVEAPFNVFRKKIMVFSLIRGVQFMSIFFMQGIAKYMKFKVFNKENSDWLRSIFWKNVFERQRSGEVRNDLISTLIALKDQTKETDEIKFDNDSLVAQSAVFFTAGSETSSTTMSLLLYHLAMYPDVQEKLANEIAETFDKLDEEITYERLLNMAYLDMCIKEILRLFPPLPYLDRECTVPYRVPGTDLTIDKGTYVYMPIMGIQTDERYFKHATSFRPERFDKDKGETITPFTYIPFGEGPRKCIGDRYGMLQIRLGLVRILHKFRVEKCPRTQEPLQWLTFALSPTAKDGIHLRFVERGAQ